MVWHEGVPENGRIALGSEWPGLKYWRVLYGGPYADISSHIRRAVDASVKALGGASPVALGAVASP